MDSWLPSGHGLQPVYPSAYTALHAALLVYLTLPACYGLPNVQTRLTCFTDCWFRWLFRAPSRGLYAAGFVAATVHYLDSSPFYAS